MKTYTVTLKSKSPVAFGRYYSEEVAKLPQESHEDYERRTWMNRVHVDKNNQIVISGLALKNCLAAAAKYLSERIPGKGTSTYTKNFVSGVQIVDPITLPVKKEDVKGIWLFVPADGVRGGGKRVMKCFPQIDSWEGTVAVHVMDETITKEVLARHLACAGDFIGIGSLRVQNNGILGRFGVESVKEV